MSTSRSGTVDAIGGASRGGRTGASRVSTIVLVVAVVAAAGALLAVAIRGPARPQALDDRVRAVAATMRCPVCADLSVADSPSMLARQMRDTIRRALVAGESADAIRSEFVAAYGRWILISPSKHGADLWFWIVPLLVAVGAAVLGTVAARRWLRRGRADRRAAP